MSRKCDWCGTQIRDFFTHTTPTLRQDENTGRTYRFCSATCADEWTSKRNTGPRPSPQAARAEDDRKVDERWASEGGAEGPAQ